MTFSQTFLRDSAVYALPTLASRGVGVILFPLYTRVLSAAEYGSLDLLMVFATFINLTIALEVSQAVARFYPMEQNAERKIAYASTAFWFTVSCYTLFLAVVLSFSTDLSSLVMGRADLESVFQVGMVYIWLNGIFYLIQNQLRSELRSKSYATVSLLATCVTAAGAVALAYGLSWGLAGILYASAGGAFVGCGAGLWCLRTSYRFHFRAGHLLEMIRFSAPLVLSGIAVFVSLYIDRLMINHFLSLDDVGVYGIGFRVASVANVVMLPIQIALTPLIYAHYQEEQTPKQLALLFRWFLVLALLMFLSLSLFADEIIRLFATPAYYSAATVVVYLVPALLLSNMYIFAPGIALAGKTRLVLYINLLGAVLHAVLNWLLVPALGIRGASLAMLLGYACVFVAYMGMSQRLYVVPHKWRRLGVSVIGVGVLAFGFSDVGSVAMRTAALVGACCFFIVTGLVQNSELRHAGSLFAHRFLPARQ
ncbi:MAG TPA: flippase [Nitrospira sp.]|nr:flippase [Nitrospira sp.]